MRSAKILLPLALLLLLCRVAGAAVGGIVSPPSGGGAPNVTTYFPGTGLAARLAAAPNGSAIQLGDGSYTVTPSILQNNLSGGSEFSGIKLLNKTNITIIGIPGQTIIDASSTNGEALWISNCSNIKISGVTFRGYTNDNFLLIPPTGNWAAIALYKCERVTFDGCIIRDHVDHGIWDFAATIGYTGHSTNEIRILNCSFYNGGSWRTNLDGVSSHFADGTCIVPTGWTIAGCTFDSVHRCIEPYDDNTGGSVFQNCVIRDNNAHNVLEFFVGPAGSTNAHNVLVEQNSVNNDVSWVFHGTNWGSGGIPWPTTAFWINGGRGWRVRKNTARGGMYLGYYAWNSASLLDDCVFSENQALEIHRGDGLGIGFLFGDDSGDTGARGASVRRLVVRNNFAYRCAVAGYYLTTGRDVIFEGNVGVSPSLFSAAGVIYGGLKVGVGGYVNNRITNAIIRGNLMVDHGVGAWTGYILENSIESCTFENNQAFGFVAVGGITNRAGSAVSMLGVPKLFASTIDFPSIGAGGSYTTNFAAAGTRTNDSVFLSMPAQVATAGNSTNLTWMGWASNDTVYVRFANVNAANAQDPQSVRINAIVRAVEAYQQ